MKLTVYWLLVTCSVLGSATPTQLQPLNPKCLLAPWDACVPDNIKVRDSSYHSITCICLPCSGHARGVCAPLSDISTFPAAQWVALRGVPVGNLSSETLRHVDASSLEVLVLLNAGISTIENNTFAAFPHLRSVHLDYNILSQLKRAYFSGWNKRHDSTVYLSFSYNRIARLEAGCFDEISYLAMLDLSHNLLSEVASGWFRGLASLHTLILSHNQIETISSNALNSLYDLRVLNLSHNPLTCLSERTLSGLLLQTFSVGGERPVSWEQDIKMNWSLIMDETFPHRKQEVRLRIDNLRFCLIYSVAQKHFQLKWVLLDKYSSKGKEPGCSSFALSPLHIKPPFVVTTALGRQEKNFDSVSYLCPEAWTRPEGIALALKGDVGLKLVGIDNLNNGSDGIAFVSSFERNPDSLIGSKREPVVRNISCLVFFRDPVNILSARRFEFQGAEGGAYSVYTASNRSQDTPGIQSYTTRTEPYSPTTNSATEYLEKGTNGTRLTDQPSTTLPTAKGTASLYLYSLLGLPVLLILTLAACVYNVRTDRNDTRNGPDTTGRRHLAQSGVGKTIRTTTNTMYEESKRNMPNSRTDLPQQILHRRSSVLSTDTYSEIKDEDVYDPTRTHTYAEIKDEEAHGMPVNAVRVQNSKLNVATTSHASRQFIDTTDLISNPMFEKSSAQPTDCSGSKEQLTHRQSTLSTHSYCEIDEEAVYDPSLTHTYSYSGNQE